MSGAGRPEHRDHKKIETAVARTTQVEIEDPTRVGITADRHWPYPARVNIFSGALRWGHR